MDRGAYGPDFGKFITSLNFLKGRHFIKTRGSYFFLNY